MVRRPESQNHVRETANERKAGANRGLRLSLETNSAIILHSAVTVLSVGWVCVSMLG